MQETCPYCQKKVKRLKTHIRMAHPEKLDPPPGNKEPTVKTPGVRVETLEIKSPTEKVETAAESGYHCVDCGEPVNKGQENCPKCGIQLDWSSIE